MTSRNAEMEAIFSELSEKNKDIVILIARSIKVAQESEEETREPAIGDRPAYPRCYTADRQDVQ